MSDFKPHFLDKHYCGFKRLGFGPLLVFETPLEAAPLEFREMNSKA
jgi:hypothetical protein